MQESSPNDSAEKRSLSADEFHSIDDLIKSRSAMDKLKTIRPFSECDLLNLHENSYLLENGNFIDKFIEVNPELPSAAVAPMLVELRFN